MKAQCGCIVLSSSLGTDFTQGLVMLKAMDLVGFFFMQFSSAESDLEPATVSYSSVSKDFFCTTSDFLVLSPSDLLTHTRKLNKSDLFNPPQFVKSFMQSYPKASD